MNIYFSDKFYTEKVKFRVHFQDFPLLHIGGWMEHE
jgi:hypothetical protein